MDTLAPLVHEYTFQALINDLLKVDGEIAHMPTALNAPSATSGLPKTETEKQAEVAASELVLSEDDPLWLQLRPQHIGPVLQFLTKTFKEFKSGNKMAVLQSDKGDKAEVKDMIKAMKDMPEYKVSKGFN
jgi:syntaxin-binding protein 1